jgi:hypothetical protein
MNVGAKMMCPEIESRFGQLEERRKKLVERVRALPEAARAKSPGARSFSPNQLIMHMALAEGVDLGHMTKCPPSMLAGRKPKPTFVFRQAVKRLSQASRMPTMRSMLPPAQVSLEHAEQRWDEVRAGIAGMLGQVASPDAAVIKYFPFGTLSASDLLLLLEAHSHYHETLFPATA